MDERYLLWKLMDWSSESRRLLLFPWKMSITYSHHEENTKSASCLHFSIRALKLLLSICIISATEKLIIITFILAIARQVGCRLTLWSPNKYRVCFCMRHNCHLFTTAQANVSRNDCWWSPLRLTWYLMARSRIATAVTVSAVGKYHTTGERRILKQIDWSV